VIFQGDFNATAANGYMGAGLAYGTGTPPAYGAAVVGTSVGTTLFAQAGTATPLYMPFSFSAVIPNLSVGANYWFDMFLRTLTSGVAAGLVNNSYSVIEV
jgi:hypothetical protein